MAHCDLSNGSNSLAAPVRLSVVRLLPDSQDPSWSALAGVTWVLAFVVLPHPLTPSVHGPGLAGLGNNNTRVGRGGQAGLIRGVHQGMGQGAWREHQDCRWDGENEVASVLGLLSSLHTLWKGTQDHPPKGLRIHSRGLGRGKPLPRSGHPKPS